MTFNLNKVIAFSICIYVKLNSDNLRIFFRYNSSKKTVKIKKKTSYIYAVFEKLKK